MAGFKRNFLTLFLLVLPLSCGGPKYPVKKNIITTTFYVGELANESNRYIPNIANAWDTIWLWHYGGVDDPKDRNGYFPANFTPKENPFYFALPYDDLDRNGHLKSSALKIPWFSWERFKKYHTVLKNRWIRIEANGKVAYAQWEDVGPFFTDEFDYVFGDARPYNPINGAGLDVSPAVEQYLGLTGYDVVNWQFVDDWQVPDGPWKKIITDTPVTWPDFANITQNSTYYIQLQGLLRTDIPADIYEVDLFDTDNETIEQLKNQGKVVICYFSAGSYEDWRPDAPLFRKQDIGLPLSGWSGEYWLNITSPYVRQLMRQRIDLAKRKGCDGIDPDNLNAYEHDSGFNITENDQFDYNRLLAIWAKEDGLLVGLKNDFAQVKRLVYYFDFAIDEQCYEFNECDYLKPFSEQGKPVYDIEYNQTLASNDTAFSKACAKAFNDSIHLLVMPLSLNGSFVKSCYYGTW